MEVQRKIHRKGSLRKRSNLSKKWSEFRLLYYLEKVPARPCSLQQLHNSRDMETATCQLTEERSKWGVHAQWGITQPKKGGPATCNSMGGPGGRYAK